MPTHKSRETGHMFNLQIIEVGDVPGHIILVAEQAGVISRDDGVVATSSVKIMADFTNGNGKAQGYAVSTFEDGSTVWVKFQSTVTANPGGGNRNEGTAEIIKGTGQYEGIQGSMSLTGKTFPGAVIQYLSDGIATYTLPSK
jgi:hypothetical protein